MIPTLLVEGVIGGSALSAVAFLLSRFVRDVAGRAFLALLLIVAALFYVVFAAREGAGAAWLAIELLGIALYGGMGLRGVRGSVWWLVAGWALHPIWDVTLHYIGPGRAFAPAIYTITCLSFDLVVAVYIAVAYRFRLIGDRRASRSSAGARTERPAMRRGTA